MFRVMKLVTYGLKRFRPIIITDSFCKSQAIREQKRLKFMHHYIWMESLRCCGKCIEVFA